MTREEIAFCRSELRKWLECIPENSDAEEDQRDRRMFMLCMRALHRVECVVGMVAYVEQWRHRAPDLTPVLRIVTNRLRTILEE